MTGAAGQLSGEKAALAACRTQVAHLATDLEAIQRRVEALPLSGGIWQKSAINNLSIAIGTALIQLTGLTRNIEHDLAQE